MNKLPSKCIEAFIAGGFTLIFFKGLVTTLCFFAASVIYGKPEWLKLIGGILFSIIGIALGFGALIGNPRARRWLRFFLFIMVIGLCLILVEPIIHIKPPKMAQTSYMTAADLIVYLTILVLLCWNKPTVVPESQIAPLKM